MSRSPARAYRLGSKAWRRDKWDRAWSWVIADVLFVWQDIWIQYPHRIRVAGLRACVQVRWRMQLPPKYRQ